jgi:hypothetical protein
MGPESSLWRLLLGIGLQWVTPSLLLTRKLQNAQFGARSPPVSDDCVQVSV